MDMGDMFRRFFGLRSARRSDRFVDADDSDDDDSFHNHMNDNSKYNENHDDTGMGIFFGSLNGLEDMFEHFHGDMQRQMEAIQKEMEDIMRGFGAVDFSSVFHGPTFREIEPSKDSKAEDSSPKIWFGSVSPFFHNGLRKEKQSPRDFMLKENYLDTPKAIETPSKGYEAPILVPHGDDLRSTDSDLDGKISEDKLIDLIKKPNVVEPSHPEQRQPSFFSTSKSYSFSTFRGPDGRIEEKRVSRDSSGREESTVTMKLGDRAYSVTEVTHPDGKHEKRESYNNVDEKDLSKFLESWSKPNGSLMPPPQHSDLDSKDVDLFSKLFGRKF
uniref:HCLS1-associated protein X-1 n=1 Tax=Biomphalaria glabrata TaxID=6526 RepID=A0A2C9KT53_BIOGL